MSTFPERAMEMIRAVGSIIRDNPTPRKTEIELKIPADGTLVTRIGYQKFSRQTVRTGDFIVVPVGCDTRLVVNGEIIKIDDIRPRRRLGNLADQIRVKRGSEKFIVREGQPRNIHGLGLVTYRKSGW